jgi:hypothetical protein
MKLTQIMGFVAGFGTTFAALPDLLAMRKRRSSSCGAMAATFGHEHRRSRFRTIPLPFTQSDAAVR